MEKRMNEKFVFTDLISFYTLNKELFYFGACYFAIVASLENEATKTCL